MENKNISQIAFERIKEKGIKPISRKIFSIKRVLFWTLIVLSLIIGAFVFALILSGLFNNDWDLYSKYGLNFVLRSMPYFWIVSLIIFTILGEYYYRKTLLGYRRSIIVIIEVYLVSSVVFGSMFYIIGMGKYIENSLSDNIPNYTNIILNRHEMWSHPEDGLLSGKIISLGDGEIQIIDLNNSIWVVSTKDAFTHGMVEIEVGERIKIMGDKIDTNLFKAEEIRPWFGPKMNGLRKALILEPVGMMR